MTELVSQLDPARVVRIHRSDVVNIDRLAKIEATDTDSRVAVLRDGTRLPISRSGYARLAPPLR
jgi:two-component system LytT family response regulator